MTEPAARVTCALVVDDEDFMRELLCSALAGAGVAEVRTATGGARALALLGQVDDPTGPAVSLVVCDLSMPDMDGVEFLRHLAARRLDLGVVLVSGKGKRILRSAESLGRAHGLRILGSLEKPVTRAALAALLGAAPTAPPSKPAPGPAPAPIGPDELRSAIRSGELTAHFQPKVDVLTRSVIGVEALARWFHPTRRFVPPDQFIAAAEAHGLIDELTELVLDKALTAGAGWQRAGHDLSVAVNISMDSVNRLDLPELVASAAERAGMRLERVMLEITESRLMGNVTTALDVLTRLRLKGVGLSIDDFGTGYSSLEQLERVPFVELKIDRAFVNGATRDAAKRAILESAVALARKLDLTTVAEGVETADDWRLLAELGCDLAQGYWIGKPMAAEALSDWIDAWRARPTTPS